jgi:hypothetical protein
MLGTRLDVSVIDSVASAKKMWDSHTFVGPIVSKWRGQIDGFTRFEATLLQKKNKEKLRLLKQN